MKFGIFIKCPQIEIIETCGISNLDFVVIDMEHTPLGPSDLKPLVLAAEVRKLDVMIRIPVNKEEYFKWALDLGFKHIQVPQVRTAIDATNAIKEAFFYPKGERGLCRFVRASDYSFKGKDEYLFDSMNNTQLTLQIEGVEGVKNIDEILSVSGVQSIMIGPYDLSQSLGVPGDIWNKKVVDEMIKIIKKCKNMKINVGTFTDTIEGLKFWKKNGIDFIQYSSDMNLFLDSLSIIKKQLNGEIE
jgi:4-hydroxy-2-oxoheptanedioate aldolase